MNVRPEILALANHAGLATADRHVDESRNLKGNDFLDFVIDEFASSMTIDRSWENKVRGDKSYRYCLNKLTKQRCTLVPSLSALRTSRSTFLCSAESGNFSIWSGLESSQMVSQEYIPSALSPKTPVPDCIFFLVCDRAVGYSNLTVWMRIGTVFVFSCLFLRPLRTALATSRLSASA
jgi:hypothetical protein